MKPVKSIPFSFTRVRLKGADNPNLLIVAGQITNQGDKVYRNVLITVQIGANRLEEVLIPGLISPGQTRKFESFIERDRTSVRNPVYVQEVKYSER
ncbi:hypothetical protein LBWT_A0860 (plasmid) [Leptolyngbya boryana IAM M-101]|nr:hypothetical protein LBWT_A0860 [Leptolyngbya boryana IAM M-101]BAS66264.1 hypothetical protein LBDG_A0860 [Leptolyngbya boryana dg5]